jgi:hypothetical protein
MRSDDKEYVQISVTMSKGNIEERDENMKTECEDMGCIRLLQDRYQRQAVVKTVRK